MGLEVFEFITSLVRTNPEGTDGVNVGDDHIRGVKQALQDSWPNIDAACTPIPDEINSWEARLLALEANSATVEFSDADTVNAGSDLTVSGIGSASAQAINMPITITPRTIDSQFLINAVVGFQIINVNDEFTLEARVDGVLIPGASMPGIAGGNFETGRVEGAGIQWLYAPGAVDPIVLDIFVYINQNTGTVFRNAVRNSSLSVIEFGP